MNVLTQQPSNSYVLTHLDVYDWGAFGGRHSAPIDLEGTAIIGPTGSGKTTLVDALMTLLVASPRYNLASTGGHESDRDLVSYIRGVSGAGNDGDSNEHIARTSAVVTAISARFSNGESIVRIGGLFWFDDTSSAVDDLKRRWLFCEGDSPTLDDWLEAHHEGGARALKELERASPGLKIYEPKKAYLARLRSHFEVGENAFSLLNRAAGLKQLNSIDTVFRELVLDDRSAFGNARSVTEEFDTLAGIRQEMETAKKQRDSLLPIAANWTDLEKYEAERIELNGLKKILPVWFAQQADARFRIRQQELETQIGKLKEEESVLAGRIDQSQQEVNKTHAAYVQAGGGDIERLRGQIKTQQALVDSRERAASIYQATAGALGMGAVLSAASVRANLKQVAHVRPLREKEFHDRQQDAWDLGAIRKGLEEQHKKKTEELVEVRKRPGSNVPVPQQDFRQDLARHLGLREEDLPFVAELVQVKAEDSRWRGAIERAIGGERLRILVDSVHAGKALEWVNARNNKQRVRIHEVEEIAATAKFFEDGFTRKLNFKSHAMREALKRLLANVDRHCVANVTALRATPHAITAEGLMSGRKHFFDKDDERSLNEGWMTGFDNRDQIEALEADINQLKGGLQEARGKEQTVQRQAEEIRKSLGLLDALERTVFEDIDAPGARAILEGLEKDLAGLTSPESDAAQAERLWRDAIAAIDGLRSDDVQLKSSIKNLGDESARIESRLSRLAERIGRGLEDQDSELALSHFSSLETVDLEEFEEAERKRDTDLQAKIDGVNGRCSTIEKRLIGLMKDAKQLDTGALTNTGGELQDVPDYLERLRVLEQEALPEKAHRFQTYLTESSDQGVTQLLSEIDNEVTVIEERIADLNCTLERVDFQPGRYLRLEPQREEHESLKILHRARMHLRSAQLKDDLGESHYRALSDLVAHLRDAVDRPKVQGSQALLDPRYRLRFVVLVIERESGKIIERRTSSQGGSGGEKEIIASYVLTASLSYALCPEGRDRPLFGTIVLDEAFSKSSQAVAGRIIRALTEFGLHPLFVTPNKELRLLREHTRSAIVVHRKGMQATMTALSWEMLEDHARHRAGIQGKGNEVA